MVHVYSENISSFVQRICSINALASIAIKVFFLAKRLNGKSLQLLFIFLVILR